MLPKSLQPSLGSIPRIAEEMLFEQLKKMDFVLIRGTVYALIITLPLKSSKQQMASQVSNLNALGSKFDIDIKQVNLASFEQIW